jgi:hypothetical protein
VNKIKRQKAKGKNRNDPPLDFFVESCQNSDAPQSSRAKITAGVADQHTPRRELSTGVQSPARQRKKVANLWNI